MTVFRAICNVGMSAAFLIALTPEVVAQDNTEIKYDKPGTVALREQMADRTRNRAYDLVGTEFDFKADKDTPKSLEAYSSALAISRCIADSHYVDVTTALAAKPASQQEEGLLAASFKLGMGCGSPGTSILTLQRGMLSEAAYLGAGPSQKPLPRNVDSAAVAAFVSSEEEWNDKRMSADAAIVSATNCLVATNPAIADLLARTEHGSDDEEIVMDALFNAAPQCAGARPSVVSKTFLRAFVMDSLYRASISEVAKPIFDLGG